MSTNAAMPSRVVASAPGKLLLLGEYAVVRGAPAVVTAVERRVRVEATRLEGDVGTIAAPQLGLTATPYRLAADGTVAVAAAAADRLHLVTTVLGAFYGERADSGESWVPLRLQIDSSPFFVDERKIGFGSSAAVATALWGAVAVMHGAEPDASGQRKAWYPRIDAAHRLAQGGVGSGVDVAASLYGGALVFERGRGVTPIALPAEVQLVALWSGHSASTPSMVRAVEAAVERSPQAAQAMAHLEALARAGAAAMATSASLLAAIDDYHEAMAALGRAAGVDIVSAVHQTMASLVRRLGGRYKPSGAGGGDFGIAVTDDERVCEAICAAGRAAGFPPLPVQLAHDGLRTSRH